MKRWKTTWGAALALLTSCAADVRGAVIDDAPPASRAEEVFVVLEGEVPVRAATLRVDGEDWGRFEATAPAERVLLAARPQAGDLTRAEEWVRFLERDLPPGGHVLEVVEVETAEGARRMNAHVPFVVEPGHHTSYAGAVAVTP